MGHGYARDVEQAYLVVSRAVHACLSRIMLGMPYPDMSNFMCEKCGAAILDSPHGYTTACEHYPLDTIYRRKEANMGYIKSPTVKVSKIIHRITFEEGVSKEVFAHDLQCVPDHAVIYGFCDDDTYADKKPYIEFIEENDEKADFT